MANWREKDKGPGKSSQSNSNKTPAVPPSAIPSQPSSSDSSTNAGGKKNWRKGSSAAAANSSEGSGKLWSKSETKTTLSPGAIRRRLLLTGLFLLLFGAIGYYCYILFYFTPPLQVLVAVSQQMEGASSKQVQVPFATESLDQLTQTNLRNMVWNTLEDRSKGYDRTLSEVEKEPLRGQGSAPPSFLMKTFNDKHIRPGGPSRSFIVMLVSTLAQVQQTEAAGAWSVKLATRDSVPLAWMPESQKLLDGTKFMTAAAEAVPPGHIGILVLDISSPPVISDLARPSIPLVSAIRDQWKQIPDALRDRLVVVVPFADFQTNWGAPELNDTIFRHFLRRGLAGDANEISGNRIRTDYHVTLRELQEYLNFSVNDWSLSRRGAPQTPTWLMTKRGESFLNSPLVSLVGTEPSSSPSFDEQGYRARTDELLRLWKDHARAVAQGALERYPERLSEVEAMLVRLEALAESGKRAPFQDSVSDVGRAMESLLESDPALAQVSLEQWQGDSAALQKMLTSWTQSADPFFVPAPNAPPTSPPIPQPESKEDAAKLMWEWVQAKCQSTPDIAISAGMLDKVFSYLDKETWGASRDPDWIEIHFLRLLRSEIDWAGLQGNTTQLVNVSRACSTAIAIMKESQIATYQIRPEVHHWSADSIARLDGRFHESLDLLFAGDAEQAQSRLTADVATWRQVRTAAEGLNRSYQEIEIALWRIPHLLRWLALEHELLAAQQVANQANTQLMEAISADAKELGRAAKLAIELSENLSNPEDFGDVAKSSEEVLKLRAELAKALEPIYQRFLAYANNNTGANSIASASASADTYRRARIAMINPLTPAEIRLSIRESMVGFLKAPVASLQSIRRNNDSPAATKGEGSTYATISLLKAFSDELPDNRLSLAWRSICIDPSLRSFSPEYSKGLVNSPLVADCTAEAARTQLAAAELEMRLATPILGQWPELRKSSSEKNSAPVAYPAVSRRGLDKLAFQTWLVQRCTSAMWGNGSNGFDRQKTPYFQRIAEKMAAPTREFEPVDHSARWIQQARVSADNSIALVMKHLGTLKPRITDPYLTFSPVEQIKDSQWSVAADGLADRVAAMSLRDTAGKIIAWNDKQPNARIRAVSIGATAIPMQVGLYAYLESNPISPVSSVAYRGHLRSDPLQWKNLETKGTSLNTLLVHEELAPPQVIVLGTSTPRLEIVLALDCSQSMEQRVTGEGIDAQGRELRDMVKEAFGELLLNLGRSHKQVATIEVQILLFGARLAPGQRLDANSLLQPMNSRSQEIFRTSMYEANREGLAKLLDAVDELSGSTFSGGETPLYAAMEEAFDCFKEPTPQTLRKIIFFTDGMNDSRDPKNSSTIDLVKDRMKKQRDVDIQLNLFGDLASIQKWYSSKNYGFNPAKFTTGLQELKQASSSYPSFQVYQDTDFGKIRDRILRTIPQSEVEVVRLVANGKEQATSEKIYGLNQEFPLLMKEPGRENMEVGVRGAFAREQATLPFSVTGGERLQFSYSLGERRLELPSFRSSEPSFVVRASTPWKEHDVWSDYRRSGNAIEFDFALSTRDNKQFTHRPGAMIAEITPIGSSGESLPIMINDFKPLPGRHFPIFRTALIPWWNNPNSSDAHSASIKLWLGDAFSVKGETVEIPPNEKPKELELRGDQFTISREENELTVNVQSKASGEKPGRWLISLPGQKIEKSERRFSVSQVWQEHRFELPPDLANMPISLRIQAFSAEEGLSGLQMVEWGFVDITP